MSGSIVLFGEKVPCPACAGTFDDPAEQGDPKCSFCGSKPKVRWVDAFGFEWKRQEP